MKRKRLDRDIWTDILDKRYIQKDVNDNSYKGIVSILYIDKVKIPVAWEYPDTDITVCDDGMKWLQFIPSGKNFVITAMVNADNKINLWYIDMIAGYGMDDDGVAYFDDLYLDLVVRPNGDIKVDDMDELIEALEEKDIDKKLYNLALETKDYLISNVLCDINEFNKKCLQYINID